MTKAADQINQLQKELNDALAQRALTDEKIMALRNVMQGASLGVELQKQIVAEEAFKADSPPSN